MLEVVLEFDSSQFLFLLLLLVVNPSSPSFFHAGPHSDVLLLLEQQALVLEDAPPDGPQAGHSVDALA